MLDKLVDFLAVSRVASRVELKDIRVVDVVAKCHPSLRGALEPTIDFDCRVSNFAANSLEIACAYDFTAKIADVEAAKATVTYNVVYEIKGNEPLVDSDLTEFASANGTLHSWPFIREFIYSLTSRMGYPPYTLPVVHFKPKPNPEKPSGNSPEEHIAGKKQNQS